MYLKIDHCLNNMDLYTFQHQYLVLGLFEIFFYWDYMVHVSRGGITLMQLCGLIDRFKCLNILDDRGSYSKKVT